MDLSPYVNVVDVYEAASDIGRDLEQLAERYGQESIEKVVPKICIVLEQLEQSVVRGDRDTSCRAELQTVTEQMELQRQERKQTRLRHENEISQMEIDWHQEVSELTVAMEKVLVENEKLRLKLDSQRSTGSDIAPFQGGHTENEAGGEGHLTLTSSISLANISSLKESMTKCKEEVRAKVHELEETQILLINANADMEKQAAAMQVQKKRNKNLHNQARKLMAEKNELTIQLRECMLQMISLEHDTKTRQQPGDACQEVPTYLPTAVLAEKSSASGSDYQDESAELPRFTLNELRSLINERNQLKVKVMELQDELNALKPISKISPGSSVEKCIDAMEEVDLDAPVQGPINREPADKLVSPSRRRRPESMIRNLFRGLLGDTSVLSQGIFYNLKESSVHLAD